MTKRKIASLLSYGTSMFPLFWQGDLVYLKTIKKNQLKIDDIVTVEKKSFYFTHRVVYIDSNFNQVITKGDNNFHQDKPFKFEQIIGKVEKIKRFNKVLNLSDMYLLQSSHYLDEVKKVNQLFTKNNLKYVILKGLPVYLHYNKTHPRRLYSDCDLLIDYHDYEKTKRLFASLGYQRDDLNSDSQFNRFINKTEYTFSKKVGLFKIIFDVHIEAGFLMVQVRNLSPLYSSDKMAGLSNFLLLSCQKVKIGDQDYPLMSHENQIIYLALHLFHDNFSGYYKYLLLEQVINYSKVNEKVIIDIIQKYQLQNFIYPVFAILFKRYSPKFSSKFLHDLKKLTFKSDYMDQIVRKTDIFSQQPRVSAGVRRFINIYYLSPEKQFIKPLVFLNVNIIYLVFFVVVNKLYAKWKKYRINYTNVP